MYIQGQVEMQNKEVYLTVVSWFDWFTRKWKQVDVCSYYGKRRKGYGRMLEISVHQCWDWKKGPNESTLIVQRKQSTCIMKISHLMVQQHIHCNAVGWHFAELAHDHFFLSLAMLGIIHL